VIESTSQHEISYRSTSMFILTKLTTASIIILELFVAFEVQVD